MFKSVMVTVDGSELSERAIEYATRIIAEDGCITLLSAVDLPDITAYGMYPMPIGVDYINQTMEYAETGTRDYIARLADDLRKGGTEVIECTVVGDAATSIVAEAQARGIEAIVMSTHGRSGINQWLFGSVTQKVLSRMPCPVFVVPGRLATNPERSDETEATTETG